MNQARALQFERIADEFVLWRAVPENDRSPAPAWWWGPAMDTLDEADAMPMDMCANFELSPGSSYGSGAEALTKALAEQTSPAWPGEFPKKLGQPDPA